MINPPSTNFAEQWINQYTQLNKAINYKAFDFNGIKLSLINYLRTYHPESFNNLTETDELLALIELFAYVGELYAYRTDINTQEQILSSVTAKSSALQIANMLGYAPSRRTAAIGLVKITSVTTSESIIDSDGSNLARRVIKWTDPTNVRWKSQFDLVMRRILNTSTGVFSDSDKTQVENVAFERYVMNTKSLSKGVYPYTTQVNGLSVPMELVGTQFGTNSISELPPTGDRPIDVLYANDGYGDSSPTSGYMFLTKQGSLASTPISFDGSIVNLTQPINASGINDTDIWLNTVDAAGTYLTNWSQVDNVAYNQSAVPTIFQVVSLDNDAVSLVFGDGNYATIPNGTFQIWYRTSLELNNSIPVSSITNQQFTVGYLDVYGNNQTLTCTFTLQNPITTSSAAETLDQLKQAVPGVFYTQDRMVNAQDHQNYLLQDPSIAKLKAVNRTFAGHSKYSSWYDGSESYENIKIFSNDGVLYLDTAVKTTEVINTNGSISFVSFVLQNLTQMLVYPEMWTYIAQRGVSPTIRTYFLPTEQTDIVVALQKQSYGSVVGLTWGSTPTAGWTVANQPAYAPDISISLLSSTPGWAITINTNRLILSSASTRFWQYSSVTGIDYDTANPTNDLITILQANVNTVTPTISTMLPSDIALRVSNNLQLQQSIPYQASVDLSRIELVDTGLNLNAINVINSLIGPMDLIPFVDPVSGVTTHKRGRTGLNFLWQHFTDQFELINPARTNITDLYVITKQYYSDFLNWLQTGGIARPTLPSVLQLSTAYSKYMQNAMMSDELVLRPGKFKVLFGPNSDPTLRAQIQLVLAPGSQVSADVVKQDVVTLVRQYFDISNIQFGDTLYFSNLSAYLQNNSRYALGSILLIPLYPGYQFGDLYELTAAPDEIFVADVSISDIQIVTQLTSTNLRQ